MISVITPSYNQGKYLGRCIQSVQRLGLIQWEHIVVDNMSTDETVDVLKRNDHLVVIRGYDRGQSDAFNKGLAVAKGEVILWLNADDVILGNYKSAVERFIDSDCNVAYGNTCFIDYRHLKSKIGYNINFKKNFLIYGVWNIPTSGSLFKRSSLDLRLAEEYHLIMDTEFAYRNISRIKSLVINDIFTIFSVEVNKTAEQIQTGTISPKHFNERRRLRNDYPNFKTCIILQPFVKIHYYFLKVLRWLQY